jgi:PRC-barrel domain
MIRALSLVTVLATSLALPAMAEEAKTIAPGAAPTSTMSDQVPVPQMKRDAQETDNKSEPAAAQQDASISLTEQEALTWINKPVYSSDGKKIGEVAAFQRDAATNKVIGMHADIGGFLGIGQTRVKLTPAQFKLQGDRVVLDLTAEQTNDLPKAQK